MLNVASIAAFLPGPGMAVYYASKAYVLSFTEALHQEWSGRGIRVSALCPGPVPTEFQARAKMELPSAAKMIELPPDRVAQIGYDGAHARRACGRRRGLATSSRSPRCV